MCGPKQARLRTTASTRQTLAPQNSIPKTFADETAGFEELDLSFSRPFNSFTAPVGLPDKSRTSGLRFPLAPKKKDQDDGFIPTLNPAANEQEHSDIGSVYNFGEDALSDKLSNKITRGIQDNHRLMTDKNNFHRTGLAETFSDEAKTIATPVNPNIDIVSQNRPTKPKTTGARTRLVTRETRISERPQREHERLIKERELWAIRDKTTTNETLDRIDHLGGLKEWNEAKTGFKLVGVDILVGVYKLPEQTARQVMLTLEGAINTGIKTKNLILSRDTKTGELVVLPKPGVTNSITGKILGEMIGMFLPGGLVAKGFKGVKTYQQLRNVNNLTKRIGRGLERGLGSLLFSDERDKFFDASFGKNGEGRRAVDDYINGKSTKDIMLAKLKKAGLDMLVITEAVPLLALYKTVQNTTNFPTRAELLPPQRLIDSARRRKARHGNQ